MPAAAPTSLRALLDERARSLVGRDAELAALERLLEDGGPLVAWVHGVAGTGKSTLARAFAATARDRGAGVVQVDARAAEPSPDGLLAALGEALGAPVTSVAEAARAFADLDHPPVLVVDAVERLRLLEDWLRDELISALPLSARVVLVSREAPVGAWAGGFADLITVVRLGGLDRAAAEDLLRDAGVAEGDVPRIWRVARGHPLALRLTASAVAARPDLPLEDVAVSAVLGEVARLYLDGLDAPTRRALDAAAVVRRPTVPLLEAMLPEDDAADAFQRLEALPFAEIGPDGLVLQDTVREALDAGLRARDPERRRALRAAAWRRLRDDLSRAAPEDLWRATADMVYLVDDPLVREAFFPSEERRRTVDSARPEDAAALREMLHRHEPPATAERLGRWVEAAWDDVRVARDGAGRPVGFSAVCEPTDVGPRLIDADSVASLWREHLRRHPVAPHERVLFHRVLATDDGGLPNPAQGALWVDLKRRYVEMRPNLRRIYVVLTAIETCGPRIAPLGFVPIGDGPVVIEGVQHWPFVLDFGPRSVDGWLARIVGAQLAEDPGVPIDEREGALVLDGRRVDLTPLEVDLLRHLHEREGLAVSRADLLRDVWGDEWQGGSNVVDVAVSGLRRKLGERAGALQTVRGVGYRLHPLI